MNEQLVYCPEYDFLAIVYMKNGRTMMDMGNDDMVVMGKLHEAARRANTAVVDYTDFIWLGNIHRDGDIL